MSWGGAPRCGRAPREGGSAPATSVHVRVCPLVSAAPCRLLTQATGDGHEPPLARAWRRPPPRPWSSPWLALLGTVPAFPGRSGRSRVSGWEAHGGRTGVCSPCSHPRACGPSPSNPFSPGSLSVPTIPTPFPGPARLPSAVLLAMPRPSAAGPGKGRGQLGSGFLVDWFGRGKRIFRVFSPWFIRYLPAAAAGGGGHCLRHLQAGFGFCCWQNEGCRVQAESQSASPQFRLQPRYYLNQCRAGFLLNHLWAMVFEGITSWAPGWRGEFGLERPRPQGPPLARACHLPRKRTPPCCEGPRPAGRLQTFLCFLQIMAKVLLIPTAGADATLQLVGAPRGSAGASPAQGGGRPGLAPVRPVALVPRCQVLGRGCRRWARGPGSRQPGAWWRGRALGGRTQGLRSGLLAA